MRVIANIDSTFVGFRHPRIPSPAVQGSIGRQYRHTTSFGMARPDLSPQSRGNLTTTTLTRTWTPGPADSQQLPDSV